MAAAAAAAAECEGAAVTHAGPEQVAQEPVAEGWDAELRPVYVYRPAEPVETEIVRDPELDEVGPIVDCNVCGTRLALIPFRPATVMCRGNHYAGQLASTPWMSYPNGVDGLGRSAVGAVSVGCGPAYTVALGSDGSLVSWGSDGWIGRAPRSTAAQQAALRKRATEGSVGVFEPPSQVDGELPRVELLAVGPFAAIAMCANDEAYGWGQQTKGQLALGHRDVVLRPVRIAALSGRGIIRLASGMALSAAETKLGQLLVWGQPRAADGENAVIELTPLPLPRARFPLRSLVCNPDSVYAADATGMVWIATAALDAGRAVAVVVPVKLQSQRRAVRLAAHWSGAVVLSEDGELQEVSLAGRRSISAAHPELPLGMLPYGGPCASQLVVAPDYSGGKQRFILFARTAMRIGVPSDPVREVLVPLMVHKVFLTGPSTDPFGCPVTRN